jgi:uncharacterized SAM-binding protein YcdF (DUF218 family)
MISNAMNKQKWFRDSAFSWEGVSTLIVSNIILILTGGLLFFYLLGKTIVIARQTKSSTEIKKNKRIMQYQILLIAGFKLNNNQLNIEYQTRLQSAVNYLSLTAQQSIVVIILGGRTGNNHVSEAQVGKNYLVAQGISKPLIILEDQSRHTLENLQNARNLLLKYEGLAIDQCIKDIAIISSRYHLYRIMTLAKGLKMMVQPIAAEAKLSFSLRMIFLLLKESYFLHWYWSGKFLVLMTANKKGQARIKS